jgi:uncharacterized protein (TIGR02301 family)
MSKPRFRRSALSAFCATLFAATATLAQTSAPSTPQAAPGASGNATTSTAYDDKLSRLAEVTGAVHYLRNLCQKDAKEDWRKAMGDLLAVETANEPERRQKLTAAFNRGYRSFAAVYTECTRAAVVAEEQYRNEGATLASEIASRFGN